MLCCIYVLCLCGLRGSSLCFGVLDLWLCCRLASKWCLTVDFGICRDGLLLIGLARGFLG